MLRRKAYNNLLNWKNSGAEKCLIINGARQVGKTFIVREFGRTEYKSFIEINFIENPEFNEIFAGNLSADSILTNINLYLPEYEIVSGDTLIFLDEIQDCPEAITALKFLADSERVDVVASGSLLGMNYGRQTSYPVGSVEHYNMFSLDFEEFLWAIGVDEGIYSEINDCFHSRRKVSPAIHSKMLQFLSQYMVLGGMPEVVWGFVRNKDYRQADLVQRNIYRDYLNDIARFAAPDIKIKAEQCYKSIPRQLSKDNHKFQYSVVENKGTARKFESSIDWIINANMAVAVTNVSFVEYPLLSHAVNDSIRLYPTDIGLLTCTYDFGLKKGLLKETDIDNIPENIVLKTVKGGLFEALVADMLIKSGHENIFFFRNEPGTVEMEFLLDTMDGVVPIEVKAGKKKTRSLNNILKKEDISYGYKLSSQNVGVADKKITLPIYMTPFIK